MEKLCLECNEPGTFRKNSKVCNTCYNEDQKERMRLKRGKGTLTACCDCRKGVIDDRTNGIFVPTQVIRKGENEICIYCTTEVKWERRR